MLSEVVEKVDNFVGFDIGVSMAAWPLAYFWKFVRSRGKWRSERCRIDPRSPDSIHGVQIPKVWYAASSRR